MVKKRNPRLEGTVREAIADIIETEFADPRLSFVTITEVEVTQDVKHATAYYTTLDPDLVSRDPRHGGGDRIAAPHEVADALASAGPRIQSLLARQVRMRNTPQLTFVPDPVAEQASRVDELLAQVRRETTDLDDAVEADGADDGRE
jgi:ribosome-binding factor A